MVALLLFVAMLWSANLAAYHWWAADFASSVSWDWDRSWGNRFAILSWILDLRPPALYKKEIALFDPTNQIATLFADSISAADATTFSPFLPSGPQSLGVLGRGYKALLIARLHGPKLRFVQKT